MFGDYIDKHDILRAVEDEFTVPIYYEGRLAKIELREEEKPTIDPEFEEITEGEEESDKQKLRTKWAALEAMVGTEKRITLVAEDLVNHFEGRLQALDGRRKCSVKSGCQHDERDRLTLSVRVYAVVGHWIQMMQLFQSQIVRPSSCSQHTTNHMLAACAAIDLAHCQQICQS